MRRRDLLLLLGGAMAAARAIRAEQKAMPVIGYLGSAGPSAHYAAAFHQGLSETGYVVGQNVTIEYRWAENRDDRLPALAADLVGRKVDLIVANGSLLCALAAKSATSTIPIVFPAISDPVADSGANAIFRRRTALSSCYRSPAPDDRYPRRVAFRPVVAELGSGAIKNGGSFDGQLAGCVGRGCPQPRQCRAASALGPWHTAGNPSHRRFSEKRNQ
jgi:hypothetical protein